MKKISYSVQIICYFVLCVSHSHAQINFKPSSLASCLSDPAMLNIKVKSTNGLTEIDLKADYEEAACTVVTGNHKKILSYPIEIHKITTNDGYILEVHRIPFGRRCPVDQFPEGENKKRVVWLQHGLMGDSSNWIITGISFRGLAYELADACYDVWMGNFRGNTYSKGHVNETVANDPALFWDFTFHEVAMNDVPAFINYALEKTGEESLFYIGHSMGTTTFFVAMSEMPELNQKIKLMSALAPVAMQGDVRSLFVKALLPFLDGLQNLTEQVPIGEMLPIEWTEGVASALCKEDGPFLRICALVVALLGGFNPKQMDMEYLPIIVGHSPAGSSAKVFLHYGQNMKDKEFRRYDHRDKNVEYYGSPEPPKYDLTKVTAHTVIYWGENDFLADKTSVMRTIATLPKETLLASYRVNDDMFSHMDFIWALDQHELINVPVMGYMDNYARFGVPTTTTPKSNSNSGVNESIHNVLLSLSFLVTVLSIFRL